MELRDYLNVARRHWLIILAGVLMTVLVSALVTAQATPQYASKAKLFVSTTPSDSTDAYQGGLFSQQRVGSYADIVRGLELAERVVEDLDLNITAPQLLQKIQARAIPDTVLIEITVTDPDAEVARRINQAVVRELQRFVKELETPPGAEVPLLKATVIDPPREAASPVTPRPTRNLAIGLFLGLLLGFGLALVRDLLDNSVTAAEDVPGVEDVPVLAHLPEDPEVPNSPLITSLSSHAPRVEAFRVLRTNLQFVDVDSASKALVFTSSLPGEGKSTTSVNAALAMAQAGRRVLIIDADMRRPQVARMLGLEGSVGLTTVLLGRVTFQDAVQLHGLSGLHVLTAGVIPPNPAELLQSQAMAEVIAVARESFDVILFDAPPLLPVTDAALIAAQTDGAVLVIRHGKTTKDQVAGAAERLASVEAQALGLVFNLVPRKRVQGSSYGYGYAPEEEANPPHARRRLPRPGERKSTTSRRDVRAEFSGRALAESNPPAVSQAREAPKGTARSEPAVVPPPPDTLDPLNAPIAPIADVLSEPTPLADKLSMAPEQTVRRPLRASSLDESTQDAEREPVEQVDAAPLDDDTEAEADTYTPQVTEGDNADAPTSPLAWAFVRNDEDEDSPTNAWFRRER